MTDAAKPHQAATPRVRASRRKLTKWIVIGILAVIAAAAGIYFWRLSELYVETEDAYVNANITEIAAQVAGKVTAVHVRDQQEVRAGDALFDIDPLPYDLAVQKARAQLELARQSSSQQGAAVAAARATLAQRDAELANARDSTARSLALVARGMLSKQAGENARTQLTTAEAAVRAAQANLVQAESAAGKAGEQNAGVQSATASLAQATLDLQHAHVVAPVGGLVANLSLRPGALVEPGTPLFAIISNDEYWVDANYKETQLKRIHPGQQAEITVDMYPDRTFKGVVESVSGGSGAAFSLLPPQNATGNWVKVTQRVPVRIRIVDPDSNYPLRVGTTASVKVSTQ